MIAKRKSQREGLEAELKDEQKDGKKGEKQMKSLF
jgi:hypothetical protein